MPATVLDTGEDNAMDNVDMGPFPHARDNLMGEAVRRYTRKLVNNLILANCDKCCEGNRPKKAPHVGLLRLSEEETLR